MRTLSEMADALDAATMMRNQTGQQAAAEGSQAEIDRASAEAEFGSTTPMDRAIQCADLWLLVATDQLHGLAVILRDGGSVFSAFPILRSVIEHASWVWYVLDDQELDNVRVRAARANLNVYRGFDQIAMAANRIGGKQTTTYQNAWAAVLRLRKELAAEFATFDLGRPTLEGEPSPGPSTVVEHFGDRWKDDGGRGWLGLYDHLCGLANHPSISATTYVDATAGSQISEDEIGELIGIALVPYLKATESLYYYMGWDIAPVNAYIDHVNAAFGTVIRDPPPAE